MEHFWYFNIVPDDLYIKSKPMMKVIFLKIFLFVKMRVRVRIVVIFRVRVRFRGLRLFRVTVQIRFLV